MTLEDFRKHVEATRTARNEAGEEIRGGLDYAVQKLCAEAGEIAQLRAREILSGRPPGALAGGVTLERRAAYALELGDALWYTFELAALLDLNVEDVLAINVAKLSHRRAREALGHSPKDKRAEQALAEDILR